MISVFAYLNINMSTELRNYLVESEIGLVVAAEDFLDSAAYAVIQGCTDSVAADTANYTDSADSDTAYHADSGDRGYSVISGIQKRYQPAVSRP